MSVAPRSTAVVALLTITAATGLLTAVMTGAATGSTDVAGTGVETVGVTSYDVIDTPISGFGGWSHSYTGTITDTGRTFETFNETPGNLMNYQGGTGTLNDGVVSATVSDNQLFALRTPAQPSITLHLSEPATVDHIVLYGGDNPSNGLPGAISSAS